VKVKAQVEKPELAVRSEGAPRKSLTSEGTRRSRILIADRFPVVREGLRHIVEKYPGWTVVAEAGDGLEAVRKVVKIRPDIAILGQSLPRLSGVTAADSIRRQAPETQVLIYATRTNDALIRDALSAGARGYLLKSASSDQLVAAIEALSEHTLYFSSMAADVLRNSVRAGAIQDRALLTGRERAILQLVAEGWTSKQIAVHLGLNQKTVEMYRIHVMRKIKASSLAELVRYAVRNLIVQP
jgi:DNA-binding NarL/FixJ family response regulator